MNGSEVVVTVPARGRLGTFAKRCLQALFSLYVLPRRALLLVARFIWGHQRAFAWTSEGLAGVPGARGHFARQAFYLAELSRCGRDVSIGWGTTFSKSWAELGESVYIGRNCTLGFVEIADGALLADSVQIPSGGHQHPVDRAEGGDSAEGDKQSYRRIRIGTNVWIGAGAVILADVDDNAVVAAGAVVTRPVPAGQKVAGVPARLISER